MSVRYTCIPQLLQIESERHIKSLSVTRSEPLLSDSDVLQALNDSIDSSSRDWDGYVLGHMDTPVDPAVISITGKMSFTNGSPLVTCTETSDDPTSFTTEITEEDWIYAESNPDAIVIVKKIIDDFTLQLTAPYYGITASGNAGFIYDPLIDPVIQKLVRDHVVYQLWANKGRPDEQNPHAWRLKMYISKVTDIQKGLYRFKTPGDKVIAKKPTKFNKNVQYTITDDVLESGGYFGKLP